MAQVSKWKEMDFSDIMVANWGYLLVICVVLSRELWPLQSSRVKPRRSAEVTWKQCPSVLCVLRANNRPMFLLMAPRTRSSWLARDRERLLQQELGGLQALESQESRVVAAAGAGQTAFASMWYFCFLALSSLSWNTLKASPKILHVELWSLYANT